MENDPAMVRRPAPPPAVPALLAGLVLGMAVGCSSPGPPPDRPPLLRPHAQIVQDEIDRAANLDSESERRAALTALAANPRLSASAQIAVTDAAFAALRFDASREDVLLTLADNPALTHAAAAYLLQSLDRLKLSSTRETVLTALHRRTTFMSP